MSIEQTDVVDFISTDAATGSVVLTISDHLDWSNSTAHQLLLQRKLHRYLSFVESGELAKTYPTANGRPVRIRVVFKFQPDKTGQRFLPDMKGALELVGLPLEYEVFSRRR